LYDKLIDLYVEYGCFKEQLVSITKKGMNGVAEINAMMETYRSNPPQFIDGIAVSQLLDYELQIAKDLQAGSTSTLALPKSNVLQFVLMDGTKISARPSGTEPKIKFYFSVNCKLTDASAFDATEKELDAKIARIIEEMGLK
jgi:phosphoglucomutase